MRRLLSQALMNSRELLINTMAFAHGCLNVQTIHHCFTAFYSQLRVLISQTSFIKAFDVDDGDEMHRHPMLLLDVGQGKDG